MTFSGLDLTVIASFALASTLIELTPGPNMAYLALISASEGRRAGFATVAGVALGLGIVGIVAALGVARVIQASILLYEALRWSGILFLLYLAWDGWRQGSDVVSTGDRPDEQHFLRGLVTNLLNPKAAVFYIAVLPTFVNPSLPLTPQTLVLTLIYVGIATLIHGLIVILASRLQPFLTNPRRERIARRTLSALLALVALWFGWTTAR